MELWNCFFYKPEIEAGSNLQNNRKILEIGLKSGKLAQLVAYFTSLPKKSRWVFKKYLQQQTDLSKFMPVISQRSVVLCFTVTGCETIEAATTGGCCCRCHRMERKNSLAARDALEWGVCEIYGIYICKTWDRSHISKHRRNVSKKKWPTTSLRGEGSADLGMLSKKVSFSCGSHLKEGKW